jgi:hypothetical protein
MADDWWKNAPLAQPSERIGYIPGTPKAKDPLDVEGKELDIRSKRLDIAKKERDALKPGGDDQASQGEQKGLSFFERATAANRQYEATGMGPRSIPSDIIHNIAPGIQKSYLPEALGGDSESRKVADANQLAFVNAVLRSDSGANAPDQEVLRYVQQFFPQPGETEPAVLEAKRRLRLQAIEGLRATAGKLAPLPGEDITATKGPIFDAGGTPRSLSQGTDYLGTVGGTHLESLPGREGVDTRVQAMLKGGADDRAIIQFLKSKGMDTSGLIDIKMQLNKIRDFQKKNPRFKGDYNIDLERGYVPN